MALTDKLFGSWARKGSVRSDIRNWSHEKRVQHFINQGLDKWMADKLAQSYGRASSYNISGGTNHE
jgi:hypothetical protein